MMNSFMYVRCMYFRDYNIDYNFFEVGKCWIVLLVNSLCIFLGLCVKVVYFKDNFIVCCNLC